MSVAGIRIESATLVCRCGHEQPTGSLPGDHERQPEHECSNCGVTWHVPSFADCEIVGLPNGWRGRVESVTDAAEWFDGSIATNAAGVILGRLDTVEEAIGAMIARGWKRVGPTTLWKTSPTQPGQRVVTILASKRAVRGGTGPVWAHDADSDMIGVIVPYVVLGVPVFVSESAG